MIKSRCGIVCDPQKCKEAFGIDCTGCPNITKPPWGDSCPVKDCCEGCGHDHCGQCADFPCSLIIEYAYDKEHGDGGKRIENCCIWAEQENKAVFNPVKFISAVAKQDADTLRQLFTPDAVICWHDSNEQFTVAEYIRANCEYPGAWNGEIQRIEKTNNGMVLLTKIFSDDFATFVTAFIRLENGKISRLDEYYADYNDEIPEWRRKMNIGKPIS